MNSFPSEASPMSRVVPTMFHNKMMPYQMVTLIRLGRYVPECPAMSRPLSRRAAAW